MKITPVISSAAKFKKYIRRSRFYQVKHLTILIVGYYINHLIPTEGVKSIYFTSTQASGLKLVYDNCLFEHTAHWFVFIRNDSNQTVTFRNCYFVNMNGQPCRRDGGVFISFNKQEKLVIENCTHIMAQGHLYKFMTYEETYEFNSIFLNHNTFINCAGNLFLNPGYQSNMYITNNIFVNCNVQPYMKGLDYTETDPDSLPMGIINVKELPGDADKTNRKIKAEKNVIAWSEALSDLVSHVSNAKINGTSEWYDQMITMNSRTQAMFYDDSYPYFTESDWYKEIPNFSDLQNLLSDQLANLEKFCIATVDLASTATLPDWCLLNTEKDYYVFPDWPIPVDLSYSDADLLTGAISGFPVGDLNWFPLKKAEWLTQRNSEYENIQRFRIPDPINEIEKTGEVVNTFILNQNDPNPFNSRTMISFSIPNAVHVTVKIFNMRGQEVKHCWMILWLPIHTGSDSIQAAWQVGYILQDLRQAIIKNLSN